MKVRTVYTKMLAVALLVLAANWCFGAFTGAAFDEHSSKFSLKNLANYSKNYSLSYLKTGSLRYAGTQRVTQQQGDTTVQVSMMRIQRGNTTFVYPYTYKFKTPKFKTPAPPPLR